MPITTQTKPAASAHRLYHQQQINRPAETSSRNIGSRSTSSAMRHSWRFPAVGSSFGLHLPALNAASACDNRSLKMDQVLKDSCM